MASMGGLGQMPHMMDGSMGGNVQGSSSQYGGNMNMGSQAMMPNNQTQGMMNPMAQQLYMQQQYYHTQNMLAQYAQ